MNASPAVAPSPANPADPHPFGLYPHQVDALRFALPLLRDHGAAYINHDVGMGKSLTAIMLARLLKAERVLVVTTKAGLGVWRAEVPRWWPEGAFFSAINYDALSESFVKEACRQNWDLLILDEAQKAKTPKSKRTHAVARLRKASRRVLLLSGTPAHTPLDYWAQFRLIAPDQFPWSMRRFSEYRAFVSKLGGPYNTWVQGYKSAAVAQVERAIAHWTHKAVKSELHLPEPIRTTVHVQLSPAETAAYRMMQKRLRVELQHDSEATAPIVLTKILRLQQITSGFLTDTEGVDHSIGQSKLDTLLDLLEEREDQKVVVAFRYGYERRAICAALEAKKMYGIGIIDGSTSDKARTALVGMFQEGRLPILLLQAQAGGTAITLTRADCLIKFSQIPSVIDNTQLEGRVHRIGTTTNVQIIDLIAPGTVDDDIKAGLERNADLVSLVSLLKRRIDAASNP